MFGRVGNVDGQRLAGAAFGMNTGEEPADLPLDQVTGRQETDGLVEMDRAEGPEFAPDGDAQAVGPAGTGDADQQEPFWAKEVLSRHVTSVTLRRRIRISA